MQICWLYCRSEVPQCCVKKAFLGCEVYSRLHLAQGYWIGYGSGRRELEFLVKVNFLSQIASLEMIEIKLRLMDSATLPPPEHHLGATTEPPAR